MEKTVQHTAAGGVAISAPVWAAAICADIDALCTAAGWTLIRILPYWNGLVGKLADPDRVNTGAMGNAIFFKVDFFCTGEQRNAILRGAFG